MSMIQYSSNRSVVGIIGVSVIRVCELSATSREIEPHAWHMIRKSKLSGKNRGRRYKMI